MASGCPQRRAKERKTERGWEGFLLCLILYLPLQGRGDTFTINCSGFDQHGVDPAAFQAAFARRAFRPATNVSIPIRVNISFTLSAILEVIWYNPFITWNAKECGGIRKLGMATKNLWLPDIFQISSLRSSWIQIRLRQFSWLTSTVMATSNTLFHLHSFRPDLDGFLSPSKSSPCSGMPSATFSPPESL
ncbi:hypothetical protein CapIbe_000458 [Capra ibex]